MFQPCVGHVRLCQGQFAKLFEPREQGEMMIRCVPALIDVIGVIDQEWNKVDADDRPAPSLLITRVDASGSADSREGPVHLLIPVMVDRYRSDDSGEQHDNQSARQPPTE
jgi:hypothetical protein